MLRTLLVLACLRLLLAFTPFCHPPETASSLLLRLRACSSCKIPLPCDRASIPRAFHRHGKRNAAARMSGSAQDVVQMNSDRNLSPTETDCCWTEVWLDESESDMCNANTGMKIAQGKTVIMLPGMASKEECQSLVNTAIRRAIEVEQAHGARELDADGLTRLPTVAAAKRAALRSTPCADPLPPDADVTAEAIFKRVLAVIDHELPSVAAELFGTSAQCLSDMHERGELEFTLREPAVNVYTAGGEFKPHKDHQALTVLLSLTPADCFEGGGTGFWGAESRQDPRSPSAVLKPPPGTALLFGGDVTHAGMAVEGGTRCVYVASFSEPGGSERRKRQAEQSRDLYGDLL